MLTPTARVLGALPARPETLTAEYTAAPASGTGTSVVFLKTLPPTAETPQPKVAEPATLEESLTLTVTVLRPTAVGVPEIRPVVALIDRPAGRPVAEYVSAPGLLLPAWTCRLTGVLTTVFWSAGLVTVTRAT